MMMRAGLRLKSVWVAYMLLAVSAGLERVPVPASHGVLFRRVHDRPREGSCCRWCFFGGEKGRRICLICYYAARRKERGDGASLAICTQPRGGLGIVCNLGGQYDDTFDDVQLQLMNYFTYKAVRTMLTQLYEMNPPSYRWFYNFVAVNKPTDGKLFLRALSKERQELAERVMVTRLHLYGKWIKKCDHGKMYEMISDENLKLMRERLMETVIWPTDDTNTEKIG
ncbi:chaperonin-like RbcX protein 2, chloroplastic [Panicum virgatum]|uniref:chaperonin-like RbcX protein 2, chloroplastic n=1 Tax=Panicum virgatum TaxID=38727 RepID=UPI0019D5A792|nr:chaperonin-like RbcX protein 2, chloroplastic [Panicum virgatum]